MKGHLVRVHQGKPASDNMRSLTVVGINLKLRIKYHDQVCHQAR